MRSSLEASSSSLCAFSSRSKAARVAQPDRQPLSDLLADELLLHLEELPLDLGQRRDIARADAALPQGRALPSAPSSSWRSSAMAGAALLRAVRWFKRLRSLSCRSCARFSISFQFRMSTSSAGNLPASPSAISRSSNLC